MPWLFTSCGRVNHESRPGITYPHRQVPRATNRSRRNDCIDPQTSLHPVFCGSRLGSIFYLAEIKCSTCCDSGNAPLLRGCREASCFVACEAATQLARFKHIQLSWLPATPGRPACVHFSGSVSILFSCGIHGGLLTFWALCEHTCWTHSLACHVPSLSACTALPGHCFCTVIVNHWAEFTA